MNWFLLLFLALLWGSSFMFMKRGLEAFPANEVALLRIFLSFVALSPFLIYRYKEFLQKHFKPVLFVGIFGSGIPPFLFAIAQTKVDSGTAGILNSLTPLFTLLVGVWLFQTAYAHRKLVGILIGLSGAILIIGTGSNALSGVPFLYLMMPAVAAACYGLSANILKSKLNDVRPITVTVYIFSVIGPLAGVALLFTDFSTHLAQENALVPFFYIILLGIGSNAVGLILFNKLIQRTDALFASMVTYLIPVVAVFWGVFDNELIGWQEWTGLLFILTGVYISSRSQQKTAALPKV